MMWPCVRPCNLGSLDANYPLDMQGPNEADPDFQENAYRFFSRLPVAAPDDSGFTLLRACCQVPLGRHVAF